MRKVLGIVMVCVLVAGCELVELPGRAGPLGNLLKSHAGKKLVPGTIYGLMQTPDGPGALIAGKSCPEIEDELKERLILSMEQAVDRAREDSWMYMCEWYWWDVDCDGVGENGGGPPAPTGDSASEYSETNNQVQGVDEADFIKNDGQYIYLTLNGKFQIIQAWPPQSAHRVAEVELDGQPRKLFVSGDRALVYVSGEEIPKMQHHNPFDWYGSSSAGKECTYGYDCEFTGDGREMKVYVFDISDRENPQLVRRTSFSGSYLNSRRIGDTVYTVSSFEPGAMAGITFVPPDLAIQNRWDWDWNYEWYNTVCQGEEFPQEYLDQFEQLKETNRQIILSTPLDQLLPHVEDTLFTGNGPSTQTVALANCESFLVSPTEAQPGFLGLATMNMKDDQPLNMSMMMGRPGAVYASASSLYVAVRQYQSKASQWPFSDDQPSEMTVLHKFWLQPALNTGWYVASGSVKGRILNQFSMDEHDDFLRVATTTYKVPNPDTHSTVTVLEQHGSDLVPVGLVDNIAPTEDIRSVRFNAEVGHIVTFKKTDPLFVLDLADPYAPVIKGELKIPGYSTYMHVLDDDHLLSIGFDADDQGSFAWFQGIALQIFDVSDLTDPQLIHKEVIGTRGSTSDATSNHLAFNYFAPKKWLALPMVVCEDGGGGSYGDEMTFNGLMVYEADADIGFDYLGGIPHPTAEGYGGCYNWWTQSNSQVKRSVIMDDWVYSIATDEIRVSFIGALDAPLSVVPVL